MIKVSAIPFQKTGFFSKTICDYLEEKNSISDFYSNPSSIEGFKNQIDIKRLSFKKETRTVLVDSLKSQYKNLKSSLKTQKNIDSLLEENTFTITTGHQLNLFTGPLYFFYKIIDTIKICEDLRSKFPKNNFIPIYWRYSITCSFIN